MTPLRAVRWIDADGDHAAEAMQDVADALEVSVVAPGDVVGVHVSSARGTWIAGIALAQRGAAMFPLGAREPDARIRALIGQAGARGLVTDAGLALGDEGASLPEACTVIATSGTTGHPKCVVHDHSAHEAAWRAQASYLALSADDRWLLSLPLHHVGGFGIVARMAHVGGTVVEVGDDGLAATMQAHAPTHVSLVPTQLRRLLRDAAATRSLRACRAVLLGGGPAPAALRQQALDAGVPLVATYGMTETLAFVAASDEAAVVAQGDTAGPVLPGRAVHVGADGALEITSPTLFAGTLEAGAFRRRAAGPYATGDVGHVDAAGVLHVVGRRDRMFISGGENIHPEEIERALCALPDVDVAVVIPVADEEFGMRPVAFVSGSRLERSALDATLRERVAAFKVPTAWYALPGGLPTPAELAARLGEAPTSLDPLPG